MPEKPAAGGLVISSNGGSRLQYIDLLELLNRFNFHGSVYGVNVGGSGNWEIGKLPTRYYDYC